MNVFVLGHTRTSIAQRLAESLSMTHVAASAWARRGFAAQQISTTDSEDFVQKITAYSIQTLKQDPDVCIKDVQAQFDLKQGGYVVEGIRNPRDFIHLFDYTRDVVVLLQNDLIVSPATPFEAGVELIVQYLQWLDAASLSGNRLRVEKIANYDEIPDAVSRCASWVTERREAP